MQDIFEHFNCPYTTTKTQTGLSTCAFTLQKMLVEFCEWLRPLAEFHEHFAKLAKIFREQKNVLANISEFIRTKKA